MVIDTSAFVAIMAGEPERGDFSRAILAGPVRLTSAATLLETTMVVLSRKGERGVEELRAFVASAGVEVVPFAAQHPEIAADAFRRYGKGRHRAGLNFGDCFAYALAEATGQPLLFKGDDFALTDLRRAA